MQVIAIFGPTGVGKTEVAIELAERLRAAGEDPVAVSADAMQVYAGLQTLSGAATPEEQARLEHRLLGFVALDEPFSAGRYATTAHAEIDAAIAAGRRPIVVGGTGLYLRAALAELDMRPPVPGRARWQARLDEEGAEALHAELARRAPEVAARVAPQDGKRLVRTLELLEAGEEPPPREGSRLWTTDTRHPTLLAGLTVRREELGKRIDARVDAMIVAGAREEVQAAAATASPTARKALGFEQLLAGDVDAMKTRTRQYARRQLTWMRKLPNIHTVDVTDRDPADVAAELHGMIEP